MQVREVAGKKGRRFGTAIDEVLPDRRKEECAEAAAEDAWYPGPSRCGHDLGCWRSSAAEAVPVVETVPTGDRVGKSAAPVMGIRWARACCTFPGARSPCPKIFEVDWPHET